MDYKKLYELKLSQIEAARSLLRQANTLGLTVDTNKVFDALIAQPHLDEKSESPAIKIEDECITSDQQETLEFDLIGYPEVKESVLRHYNIESLAGIKKDEYLKARTRIKQIIRTHQDNEVRSR